MNSQVELSQTLETRPTRCSIRLEKPLSEIPQYFWISEKVEVVVFLFQGQVKAYNSVCPHMGAQLSVDCKDGHLSCPWHGLKFDLRDARSCHTRYRKVTEYKAEVQGDTLYVG